MTPTIDVRDHERDDRRQRVFELLDDTAVGASVEIVAPGEVEPLLQRYRIVEGHDLEWVAERTDDGTPVLRVTKGEPVPEETAVEFDVRSMPPRRRHEVLLETFDVLDPGDGFVLVNDHDPKPLYHELTSMHGDVVDWEYRQQQPREWTVEIQKTGPSTTDSNEVRTTFDVREIPTAERHATIHHRYGMLPEGETMELVAPHVPRPLHREFQQQYGDAFTWEVVEQEPGRCRVHVTKSEQVKRRSDANSVPADAEEVVEEAALDSLAVTETLDVRDLPPAQRHEDIFECYAGLAAGEAFELVNDHDPKPLYHQFEADAGDEFRWAYKRKDPGEFRVLVGKADAGDDGTADDAPPDDRHDAAS